MSNPETFVHPSSIVDPKAQLDTGVHVGPFCVVGPHARIGRGTRLHSHAVVTGHTTLGAENEIFPFASVGHAPQDLKYKGEPTTLEIGDRNRIRECVTLQPGTVQGGGKTVIGNGNLFMAYAHAAHDCIVGDENVIANAVQLAGHVTIDNRTVISGCSAVHQFCRVGDYAMAAGGSILVQDLPPFCIAQGDRATLRGLNIVAMRRRGIPNASILAVKSAYKILFLSGAPTVDAAVAQCVEQGLTAVAEVNALIAFVQGSKRGVVRPAVDGQLEE